MMQTCGMSRFAMISARSSLVPVRMMTCMFGVHWANLRAQCEGWFWHDGEVLAGDAEWVLEVGEEGHDLEGFSEALKMVGFSDVVRWSECNERMSG